MTVKSDRLGDRGQVWSSAPADSLGVGEDTQTRPIDTAPRDHETDALTVITEAIETVDDPEFPGVSIVSLGMLHHVSVSANAMRVELVPTYSGCPALEYIGADVLAAVEAVADGRDVEVVWRRDVQWTPARLSPAVVPTLATEFAVTLRTSEGSLRCPVCGSVDVAERSPIGPTRCRSVAWCETCRNVIEVMR
jgi:ring-1,2-phenylacetyl-CoA epoxidase subunit PaaD